jgi:dipeptidase
MVAFAKNSNIEPVYSPNGLLDWAATFSGGEFAKYYSGRRMWRTFSLIAPSVKLEPEYTDYLLPSPGVYPFSVKVEKKLS